MDLIKCWKMFHGLCPILPSMIWEINVSARSNVHMATNLESRSTGVKLMLEQDFSPTMLSKTNSFPSWVVGSESLREF